MKRVEYLEQLIFPDLMAVRTVFHSIDGRSYATPNVTGGSFRGFPRTIPRLIPRIIGLV
jgi:hypothetical protein